MYQTSDYPITKLAWLEMIECIIDRNAIGVGTILASAKKEQIFAMGKPSKHLIFEETKQTSNNPVEHI